MKCKLVNYKKNADDTYLIDGILYNNTQEFAHWLVKSDDFFRPMDDDHLQVYATDCVPDISYNILERLIIKTINKNRLNMLYDLDCSIVQKIIIGDE